MGKARGKTHSTWHVCFLQQKKLFIWSMHYQYKLGDCKTYTVLASPENTTLARQGGTRPVLSGAGKLQRSKPNRAEVRRAGAGDTTNNQRKTLQNNWKRQRKIEEGYGRKGGHVECFIYFNERGEGGYKKGDARKL